MRMDGGYPEMLRAALDGAHVIDAAARRRAAVAEQAWLRAPGMDPVGAYAAREGFRAAHAARCAAAAEVAEIECEMDFPEALDDPEAGFPELVD